METENNAPKIELAAQHYGLPTALIDFTKLLPVALCFATKDEPDSYGNELAPYFSILQFDTGDKVYNWEHYLVLSNPRQKCPKRCRGKGREATSLEGGGRYCRVEAGDDSDGGAEWGSFTLLGLLRCRCRALVRAQRFLTRGAPQLNRPNSASSAGARLWRVSTISCRFLYFFWLK